MLDKIKVLWNKYQIYKQDFLHHKGKLVKFIRYWVRGGAAQQSNLVFEKEIKRLKNAGFVLIISTPDLVLGRLPSWHQHPPIDNLFTIKMIDGKYIICFGLDNKKYTYYFPEAVDLVMSHYQKY